MTTAVVAIVSPQLACAGYQPCQIAPAQGPSQKPSIASRWANSRASSGPSVMALGVSACTSTRPTPIGHEPGRELGDGMSRRQILGDQVAHRSRASGRQRPAADRRPAAARSAPDRPSGARDRSRRTGCGAASQAASAPPAEPTGRPAPPAAGTGSGRPAARSAAPAAGRARWPSGAAAASRASRNGAPRSRGCGRGRHPRRTARHRQRRDRPRASRRHRHFIKQLLRRPPLRERASWLHLGISRLGLGVDSPRSGQPCRNRQVDPAQLGRAGAFRR